MIASQSPVYSAIWFAMSLLGTAGLFFFNGAQFLGVATIVVYAGAIVVTFLFVIMLAQPEGHADYDRISWGWFPKNSRRTGRGDAGRHPDDAAGRHEGRSDCQGAASPTTDAIPAAHGHTRCEGWRQSCARITWPTLVATSSVEQLVSVEIAGTLLLAALVGAVAIAIQGKPRLSTTIEEALQ